jgi:hypothetical protein
VIVALPPKRLVTRPEELTVATEGAELVHVRFLFVALDGDTVATSVAVAGIVKLRVEFTLTPVTGTTTVTAQVAVNPPSLVVTVIVADPAATAVTSPDALTVAIEVAELDQTTVLFVAFDGATVATRVLVAPTARLRLLALRVTPVTGVTTLTAQVAVLLLPSLVLAVIVADPRPMAVTVPVVPTVATAAFELDQVTDLSVVLDGVTVATRVSVPPIANLLVLLLRLIPVAWTNIVTEQAAVLAPSAVVAVIAAFPAEMPLTFPAASTVATLGVSLAHETFRLVALLGEIVGTRVSLAPTAIRVLALFSVTPVTGTTMVPTVTAQEADLPPSIVVAVMVAVPAATGVTTPPETAATAALLLAQVTPALDAVAGATVAVRLAVAPPTRRFNVVGYTLTPVTGTTELVQAA